jgi:hypothetical protein
VPCGLGQGLSPAQGGASAFALSPSTTTASASRFSIASIPPPTSPGLGGSESLTMASRSSLPAPLFPTPTGLGSTFCSFSTATSPWLLSVMGCALRSGETPRFPLARSTQPCQSSFPIVCLMMPLLPACSAMVLTLPLIPCSPPLPHASTESFSPLSAGSSSLPLMIAAPLLAALRKMGACAAPIFAGDEVLPRQCPCLRVFDSWSVCGIRRTRRRSDRD